MYTNNSMTAEGHIEKSANEDGKKVETLHMEFTNGSLQQLRELAKYFDVPDDDPADFVKLAISFMQSIKDRRDGDGAKGIDESQ